MKINQFWTDTAQKYVDWITPWHTLTTGDFNQGNVQWFIGGQLNVCVNCIDRHLAAKANHLALLWEGDDEHDHQRYTFEQLYQEVNRMANVLKLLGIHKGDRVAIYLPMIPEAAIAMLACARIGAVHTVIFAGFSAEAVNQRLQTANCKLLITADGYQRSGKTFTLKTQADLASKSLNLKTLIIQHNNASIPFDPNLNFWWHELKKEVDEFCEPEIMNAEDPLFILYTSGSTGKPKGVVHTTGGYLVQTAFSHDYVFQCTAEEVYWCTADVGWITGHSYLIYGPLCNGITTLIFAGTPTWPNPDRFWKIIDKYKVNVLYTAPTAVRALKQAGDQWLAGSSRQSLRLLGSVGEPINPEVWRWYQQKVGLGKTPIVDTWWQTETGAILLCPAADNIAAKPGSAGKPLPGIFPVLLDEQGKEISGNEEGALAIKYPWPSLARTIADDHQRYCENYFSNGYYITGDGAHRDAEGDYWISGRIDDVLNVSGHRLGTAEIESALVAHPAVAEAAVVGMPHEIKGQGIYAFISLKNGFASSEELIKELNSCVQKAIGSIAKPDKIQVVDDLPKTRSGKIMRRILKKIAAKEVTNLAELGDISTLANPETVEALLIKQNNRV